MSRLRKLIYVFEDARMLLSRRDNDFLTSSWEDREDALEEIDRVLSDLGRGRLAATSVSTLFAPTGPMQEVALRSGWGQDFLDLANRFDLALEEAGPCSCRSEPSPHLDLIEDLGMEERFAEASLLSCPECGQRWLRCFYEVEAFSESGRWYLGPVSREQATAATAASARETLSGLEWYFVGGSYYGGKPSRGSGEIVL